MGKNCMIYITLVILSVLIFYILAKKKSILLKRKQEELKINNETSKNLIYLFYQILG